MLRRFKKTAALLGIGALLCMASAEAEDFPNRSSVPFYGVVTQDNNTKVAIEREGLKLRPGFLIELQYIQHGTDAPYSLIHVWANDAYDTIEIVSPSGKSLTLQEDPSLTHAGADPKVDRWYRVDINDLLALDNPNKCDIRLHRPNGKYFTVSAKRLLQQARQITGQLLPNEAVRPQHTYGPAYSVFFPNTSWQTIRSAMAYYLNPRKETMPEKIYRYGPAFYLQSSSFPQLIFNAAGQAGDGIAQYQEVPGGTWVDLDFWTSWYGQYGYQEFTQADDEVFNIGMNAVQNAYKALVPHADYGLTMNGGLNKKGPTVDTIDVTNHPELANVAHSDKVISINGISMEDQKNYVVSYMLTYGTKPLTIVFENKQNQQYTVTVQPKPVAPLYPNGNFQAVVDQEKDFHIKEKDYVWYWPLSVPGFEVFDPIHPGGHVESPVTGPLDKALQ